MVLLEEISAPMEPPTQDINQEELQKAPCNPIIPQKRPKFMWVPKQSCQHNAKFITRRPDANATKETSLQTCIPRLSTTTKSSNMGTKEASTRPKRIHANLDPQKYQQNFGTHATENHTTAKANQRQNSDDTTKSHTPITRRIWKPKQANKLTTE